MPSVTKRSSTVVYSNTLKTATSPDVSHPPTLVPYPDPGIEMLVEEEEDGLLEGKDPLNLQLPLLKEDYLYQGVGPFCHRGLGGHRHEEAV